jgi:hypothetical protein
MFNDVARGSDTAIVEKFDAPQDETLFSPPTEYIKSGKNWHVEWKCEKWHDSNDHLAGLMPDEVVVVHENLLVTGGINLMLLHLIGDTNLTAYTSGSAVIKVGNSTTAAASGDTDILGGSNAESAMDAGFPTVSITTATWKATYTSLVANFAWEEVAVKNAAGAVSQAVRILNRKVQSFGTKASGSTWTMTLTLTIT